MARKYQEKPTFNQMLADLKRQKEQTLDSESDPNIHYKHLVVFHPVAGERHVQRLFENLSPLRRKEGKGSVVKDPNYRHSGEGFATAFILRTTNLAELERTVQQASSGLPITYELKEY